MQQWSKRISNDQLKTREKMDQRGVYKITCGQYNNVYIGKTGRKYSTWMNEHAKFKAKRDDKSLFEKHCLDEGNSSEQEQPIETQHQSREIEEDQP